MGGPAARRPEAHGGGRPTVPRFGRRPLRDRGSRGLKRVLGVVSPNPRKFRHPSSSYARPSAQAGDKKELTGGTDIEIEISNQCARLIANAILYYNSAILSRLLTKYEASGNARALALITKMSPAAWRHIPLNGHYTFRGGGQPIDLDAIVARLELG